MTAATPTIDELRAQIAQAMQTDRHRLRKEVHQLRRADKGDTDKLARVMERLQKSIERRQQRVESVPELEFDPELPINSHRDEIASALSESQVLVVCGETGSGKSTQLPKICLSVGRGIGGYIGHTQPRRIAARSVAARVAEELGSTSRVGFKIRFTDTVRLETYVKLMTDGILLAETQNDRFLDQYDTIILDEAHERSLNIDFLLGYLKRLLPKRRDLRLIVTSATIDAERFAEHFSTRGSPAPIIEVSGRTYPVETRYRGHDDEEASDADSRSATIDAIAEVCAAGPGDVLVFLPTERDIRDTTRKLKGWALHQTDKPLVLPLYARLSTAEQNRVFKTGKQRRIVLATNVAESSLTVPGIRYVVDTGTARISRYSPRAKVQRLPIEPVSRASADQRQGRCGRVGPGLCIRLYSEDDYLARDAYTTPEIRRTNLASVVLQMLTLRLGNVEEFPFLDPPRGEAVRDGFKTLFELGAIDGHRRLTETGKQMSRLPVDPRIARMILAGNHEKCLSEILIIAAALELQDPRQRPPEKERQADEAHAQFAHDDSDFMAFLSLWDFFHHLKEKLSRSQLRKACQQNFLSFNRLREWQDIHRQLKQLVQQAGLKIYQRRDQYNAVHRALLTGLLSNVALRSDRHEYLGAGEAKSYLWPGSGVFGKKPKWIVAAEAVETNKRYLRTVARIEPEWIEPLADHVVKRSYRDPHWSKKQGTVLAREKVTLFGLTVVAGRHRPYAPINQAKTRHLFIQHALVEGDFSERFEFFVHNRELVEQLATFGAKTRSSRYLVPDAVQYEFYAERLPESVYDLASLRRWLKNAAPEAVQRLVMRADELLPDNADSPRADDYPDQLDSGGVRLQIDYRYKPGEVNDGVSIDVPVEALRQLDPSRLEWLVPGLLHEKLVAMIRMLPKSIRRNLIPVADTAAAAIERMEFGQGPFLPTVAATLSELAGEAIPIDLLNVDDLPEHLRVNVRVLDEDGTLNTQGRDLSKLCDELGVQAEASADEAIPNEEWNRDGITEWDFGDLPESIEVRRGPMTLLGFPSLIDRGDSVSLRLLDNQESARQATRSGIRRLIALCDRSDIKSQVNWLPRLQEMELFAANMHHERSLREQLADLFVEVAYLHDKHDPPRTADEFGKRLEEGRKWLLVVVQDVAKLSVRLYETFHRACVSLEEVSSTQLADAVADIKEQLAALTGENFLVTTPWTWLQHYPRYFDAVLVRIDRLKSGGGGRDAEAMSELRPLLDQYRVRRQSHAERAVFDDQLEEYRWMLEEYRVSLFAQQLGTVVRVSPQRLDKQWAKVRH